VTRRPKGYRLCTMDPRQRTFILTERLAGMDALTDAVIKA
jgi:hypothetical protein